MYLPKHFEERRPAVLQQAIHDHPFGLLVTQGIDGSGIVANSMPFVYDTGNAGEAGSGGAHGVLRTHVARANPLWRESRTDVDSLVVFQGAQVYISPAWYPSKAEHGKAVPTWNYVMVQARGKLRAIDDAEWLRAFVTRLTDRHESARVLAAGEAGPPAWAVDDAPADFVDTMLRAIVGVEIEVTQIVGKWKVSQNRPQADRAGVVSGLDAVAGSDAASMAALVSAFGAPT